MINRVLIRLKIVQIIYAYYQNGGKKFGYCGKGVVLQFIQSVRFV